MLLDLYKSLVANTRSFSQVLFSDVQLTIVPINMMLKSLNITHCHILYAMRNATLKIVIYTLRNEQMFKFHNEHSLLCNNGSLLSVYIQYCTISFVLTFGYIK